MTGIKAIALKPLSLPGDDRFVSVINLLDCHTHSWSTLTNRHLWFPALFETKAPGQIRNFPSTQGITPNPDRSNATSKACLIIES